ITDPMGFILKANKRLLTLTETNLEDLTGTHVGEHIYSDDYNALADIWVRMQVETDFDSAITEFRILAPRGAKWYRGAIKASRNDDLTLASLIVHFADVDSKFAAQQALDRSSRKFGNLLDSLPDPIVRLNRAYEIQFANPAAKEFRRLDPTGKWPQVLVEDQEMYLSEADHCWTTGETRTLEHRILAGDQVLWCETTFVAEVGPSNKVETMLVFWRDQTSRRRHEELLAHRALHDSLTGLPNRARFAELLELAIARQATAAELGQVRPLAVMFLDLDRFKIVNDSLGHLAGDELLQGVSSRLSGTVRPGDVIGRLGGDEFTILAEDITPEDALVMAERIQERLKHPFRLNGREFLVSASIGVVRAESPQQSADLMRWADSAMYRAKSLGRCRVVTYEEVLAPDVLDQLDVDQLIRTAIDRNELTLHYQPEVILDSGQIAGAEALLRWHHPIKGLLGADQFIPVAEENGSIVKIGAWVLRRACEDAMSWDAAGLLDDQFILRVNLSPRQLDEDGLPGVVGEILESTGLPPARLCLEVTETALMREVEHALEVLNELAALGISLAIDDFGTGYSSLSSLKRFPIDVLKIDRSFISGMTEESRDSAIVRTVIALSDTLGLVPTAEGVETEEQRQILKEMGCPRGQGYLFSVPLPADDFREILRGSSELTAQPVGQ
ncbi:MAG: EAL domain-containing protein, partial [Microthrixaceae bacterium]|nr:EAL domain-containing protein [Microthrixaceae bacterium]